MATSPEIEAALDAVLGPGHYVNARRRITDAILTTHPDVVRLVVEAEKVADESYTLRDALVPFQRTDGEAP